MSRNYDYENTLLVSMIIIGSSVTLASLVGGYYATVTIISLF